MRIGSSYLLNALRLAFPIVLCFPIFVAADDDLDAILAKWKARHQHAQSVRIIWTEQEVVPKGYWGNPDINPLEDKEYVPPETHTVHRKTELTLRGDMLRLVHCDEIWSTRAKKLVPRKHIFTNDGSRQVRFFEFSDAGYPDATIYEPPQQTNGSGIYSLAVFLAFRPLDASLTGFRSRDNFSLSVETDAMGDGRDLPVLRYQQAFSVRSMTLDPTMDYAVRRIKLNAGRPIPSQLDISYRNAGELGWLPTEWTFSGATIGSAVPNRKMTANVAAITLNEEISRDTFRQLKFLPGTHVSYLGSDHDYKRWIEREDGKRREIPSADDGATYEQLLNSEPGLAHLQPISESGTGNGD